MAAAWNVDAEGSEGLGRLTAYGPRVRHSPGAYAWTNWTEGEGITVTVHADENQPMTAADARAFAEALLAAVDAAEALPLPK